MKKQIVINKKKALEILKQEIDKLLNKKEKIIIAIDGMAASGKSRLAKMIFEIYQGEIIPMDDFFLQEFQRTSERLVEVGGNLDYERFMEEIVLPLKNNQDINYQKYSCQTKDMSKEFIKKDYRVLIIEGAYALRKAFQEIYDLKVLMLVEKEEQLKRIEKRNPRMLEKFKDIWIPMENKYLEVFKIRDIVDIIID